MFCAFEGLPNNLRLYGKGYTVLPSHNEWQDLAPHVNLQLATRQIIVADINKVQTSCGFSVPNFEYKVERTQAQQWAEKKGVDGLEAYKTEKKTASVSTVCQPHCYNL